MFKDAAAFSGFSIKDAQQTRQFYGEILGLDIRDTPDMEQFGMLELHTSGNQPIMVYTKPDHVPATFTILNFSVADIDAAVDELSAKGVEMLRYDGMHQDEKGIARGRAENQGPDIAWFTDPSGNILSVLQSDR